MLAADIRPIPWTGKPQSSLLRALWARIVADVTAATRWFGRMMCGLSGHEMIFHFEANRVSLHCLNCGQESPGWTVETKRAA